VLEVEADDISVSLKFATCKVSKVSRSRAESADSGRQVPAAARCAEADPWATEGPGGYSDEPPF